MRDNIYACNARGSLYECNVRETVVCMGWLQLVGSSKLYVSSAEYRLFYRALLHKRRFILWSLLIIATLHAWGGGAYSMAASSTLPTFVFVQKSLFFAKEACQNRALLRKRPIGWRRCIGCLNLHVSSCKRAIHYRALLRKMTCKDKAPYASLPPVRIQGGFSSISRLLKIIGLFCKRAL